jgi:hypothetical protein
MERERAEKRKRVRGEEGERGEQEGEEDGKRQKLTCL